MISWLIIGIIALVWIMAIKMNHFRHKIFIMILLLFILFLYGSLMVVSTINDLNLDSSEGVVDAGKLYFGWLANGFQNLKTVSGKVIGMDWTSTNGSFFKDKIDIEEKTGK